jgi:GDPmannose 4,6-dehydratase
MWQILQQPEPDDYVLATGETHSVREFVEKAFQQIGVRIVWKGAGIEEKGLDAGSGRILVEVDPAYFRPTEVDLLVGDSSKARSRLGWRHRVSFEQLVAEMVAADLKPSQARHHVSSLPQINARGGLNYQVRYDRETRIRGWSGVSRTN